MYINAVKIDSFTNQIYSIVSIIISYTHPAVCLVVNCHSINKSLRKMH